MDFTVEESFRQVLSDILSISYIIGKKLGTSGQNNIILLPSPSHQSWPGFLHPYAPSCLYSSMDEVCLFSWSPAPPFMLETPHLVLLFSPEPSLSSSLLNIPTSEQMCVRISHHPLDPTYPLATTQVLYTLHRKTSGDRCLESCSPPHLTYFLTHHHLLGAALPEASSINFLCFYLKYQSGCFQLHVSQCPIKRGLSRKDVYCKRVIFSLNKEQWERGGSRVGSAIFFWYH